MTDIAMELLVAGHTESIRGLAVGQSRIERTLERMDNRLDGSLLRLEAKVDTATAVTRWTPAAKAAVIAPAIAAATALFGIALAGGGPA